MCCTKLWSVEKKVVPNFILHQFYAFQRDIFLAMVGLKLKAWNTKEHFKGFGHFL